MTIQFFNQSDIFTLTQIEWVRCPVDSHEGFGWSDSQAEVVPENGDKDNPLIWPTQSYHPSYGIGNLYSLVEGLVPEPGWKVVGKGPNNTWVCVPPWYVFKQPAPSPNRWKPALAALAVGALCIWGGMQVLSQNNGVIPQTTYQTK